jgi:hypothetical protein
MQAMADGNGNPVFKIGTVISPDRRISSAGIYVRVIFAQQMPIVVANWFESALHKKYKDKQCKCPDKCQILGGSSEWYSLSPEDLGRI